MASRLFERMRREDVAQAENSRDSDSRHQAYQAGLLRPFLLLVSADPLTRLQLAAMLGWALTKEVSTHAHYARAGG